MAEEKKQKGVSQQESQSATSPQGTSSHDAPKLEKKRSWVPNRKQKKVTSKKVLDERKMAHLAGAGQSVYKGELDNKRPDRSQQRTTLSRAKRSAQSKAKQTAQSTTQASDEQSSSQEENFGSFHAQFNPCKASPGRLGALFATSRIRRRKAFAREVIASAIDRSSLSQEDRRFATLLTLGVVSCSGALDEIINHCISSPNDIRSDVRDALRISCYEIIYMQKSTHAAVDQGVELVRAIAPSAAGLGNAVLHRIVKRKESFPFGDAHTDIDALALKLAFPPWLARLLIDDLGVQAALDLMRISNEPAPLFIHVNSLKASDEEIVATFKEAKAIVEPVRMLGGELPGCYHISPAHVLADGRIVHLFQQGKVLVSDASAQTVAFLVSQAQGSQAEILEVGAGRGTKSIMIQSHAFRQMHTQLNMASMDSHGFKTDLLKERAKTYGVNLSEVISGNAARLDSVMPRRLFDTIFIDAPCSGLGTLRRHHEIRWRLTPERIEELADAGLALLRSAASHTKPKGKIIYASCTVTYAENTGLVKRFLESKEGQNYRLAPFADAACFMSQIVSDGPDAHFAACFVRVDEDVAGSEVAQKMRDNKDLKHDELA